MTLREIWRWRAKVGGKVGDEFLYPSLTDLEIEYHTFASTTAEGVESESDNRGNNF